MSKQEEPHSAARLHWVKDPRFLLMYSPLQFRPEDSAKPDGSLALPYLAASLRQHGYEVDILDACVGNDKYDLADTFYRPVQLDNGLVRVGMSIEDIAREVAAYAVTQSVQQNREHNVDGPGCKPPPHNQPDTTELTPLHDGLAVTEYF